jgi:hypothetical protein
MAAQRLPDNGWGAKRRPTVARSDAIVGWANDSLPNWSTFAESSPMSGGTSTSLLVGDSRKGPRPRVRVDMARNLLIFKRLRYRIEEDQVFLPARLGWLRGTGNASLEQRICVPNSWSNR